MIAEFHTRAINDLPDAHVVAAYSRSRTNAEKIAAMAGGRCAIHDDLDAMLATPGLDVACICTPSGAHLEPAVQAARAGKHVVVEKPLALTVAQADELVALARRRDRLLVAVGPAQRRPVALEQRTDLVGPPRLVPRLDGDPRAGRELRQALAEQLGVGLQRGR